MKKKVMALCVCIASFAVVTAWAHTYNETNDVGHERLDACRKDGRVRLVSFHACHKRLRDA